eukprot:4651564-Pleurochrysis_carterae.AAC.3
MPLPPVEEKKFTEGYGKLKICVTGAGGFIASHLARRLKAEGHYVRGVDWKENEYMKPEDFCDEFLNLDLRHIENCKKAVEGMEWCFNLAVSIALQRLRFCEEARRDISPITPDTLKSQRGAMFGTTSTGAGRGKEHCSPWTECLPLKPTVPVLLSSG